jgi:transposase
VFLDESGAQSNMTRLRGRCAVGERLVAKVPWGHWKTSTMISAVRLSGPFAAAVFDCPTDTDVFRAYVEQVLAPALCAGDVVVMDNLAAHKVAGIEQAIQAVGARVLYLPPYSPDYNPIENMWSKIKQRLRSLAPRSWDAICDAFSKALDDVTLQDCLGFFKHCGYAQ